MACSSVGGFEVEIQRRGREGRNKGRVVMRRERFSDRGCLPALYESLRGMMRVGLEKSADRDFSQRGKSEVRGERTEESSWRFLMCCGSLRNGGGRSRIWLCRRRKERIGPEEEICELLTLENLGGKILKLIRTEGEVGEVCEAPYPRRELFKFVIP